MFWVLTPGYFCSKTKTRPLFMRQIFKSTFLVLALLAVGCGGKEEKKSDGFQMEREGAATQTETQAAQPATTPPSQRIELSNKGVGPISSLTLPPEIDPELASSGEAIYNQMCLACHRIGQKFIGPAPNGVLERRSPEWVMNMIINPEVMVKEDPLAKELLMEFNGSPMANQGLTEDKARAVLEYFRTLK